MGAQRLVLDITELRNRRQNAIRRLRNNDLKVRILEKELTLRRSHSQVLERSYQAVNASLSATWVEALPRTLQSRQQQVHAAEILRKRCDDASRLCETIEVRPRADCEAAILSYDLIACVGMLWRVRRNWSSHVSS
jgi:hypothetical protein